ncbi:hypothetical protein NQD34_017616 [Periophthalmus magnuspinnatus]|nr:hypothetical protein NQD34_017616 [Periophthalmus magnuspinnatus]
MQAPCSLRLSNQSARQYSATPNPPVALSNAPHVSFVCATHRNPNRLPLHCYCTNPKHRAPSFGHFWHCLQNAPANQPSQDARQQTSVPDRSDTTDKEHKETQSETLRKRVKCHKCARYVGK